MASKKYFVGQPIQLCGNCIIVPQYICDVWLQKNISCIIWYVNCDMVKKILIEYFRLDLVNSWNGHKTLASIISWDFLTADCRFSGFLLKDNIMLNFCFTGSNNQFRNYENWSFVLRKVCWKSFFKLKTVWPDTNKQQIFINNFRIHSFRIGYWILLNKQHEVTYVNVRRPKNLKKSPTLFWQIT